jgi:hypothetical protein
MAVRQPAVRKIVCSVTGRCFCVATVPPLCRKTSRKTRTMLRGVKRGRGSGYGRCRMSRWTAGRAVGCRLSAVGLPLKSSAENVPPLKRCRYAVTEHRWQTVCCALPSAVSRTVVLWPHAGLRAVTGALHAARTVRTACSAGFFERVSLRGLLYTGFRGQTAAAGKGGRFCPAYLHVSMCLFLPVGARQDASGSADCSSRNPHAPDVPRLRFVQQARSGNIRRSSKGRGRFSADRREHCWAGTAI